MTLDRIEQEEQDRIQYEMQLAGQGGKKCKVWPSSDHSEAQTSRPGSVRVESTENYRLTVQTVKRG
ncbi:MAG: hypothetical protein JRI36_05330 [Deltaproteobacteria bacterium]|nr:hypothetical protein [Deltaproteobacteria bacterium]